MAPRKLKNLVILLASLLFYFYGEPVYSILIVLSSGLGYLHGRWIHKKKGGRYEKLPLISSLATGIGILMFFKYSDFFIKNINQIFSLNIPFLALKLPIGISFYTFQILSYTIDVYRGDAKVQRNILKFSTYVTLFPQLIAGPIVRYTTIESELSNRKHSFENTAYGINRFIIGLAKKVLLANTLGQLTKIFLDISEKTMLLYWGYVIAFMLQVYFDFSGYSDMAIGLGRIMGFHFLENFNYPFISRSISEFWRRWHISLGTWFRDYVYIPMGGNRVSLLRWIINVFVVWFLTGFWHGAQWNYVVWGLYFALFLVLEKKFIKSILEKLPAVMGHLYMLFFITISFAIFAADDLSGAFNNLKCMFTIKLLPFTNAETTYYLKSYMFILIFAIAGATPILKGLVGILKSTEIGKKTMNIAEPILHILLLLLVTSYLVDGSYNPFLYFRF